MTTEEYVKEVLKISPKYCIALSEGYVKSTMEFIGALQRLGYIKRTLKVEEIFEFPVCREGSSRNIIIMC